MKYEAIAVGNLSTNCYIVYDEILKKGIVIDPGDEGERIISLIKRLELDIFAIVFTHIHFDHILAYHEIKKEFPLAKTLLSENEIPSLFDKSKSLLSFCPVAFDEISDYEGVREGDYIEFGSERLKVIETPGHTEGCICLYCEGVLFSGDTLFFGSVGRWDFPGGSYTREVSSIKEKLFILPIDTIVLPGHGGSTTIGYEIENNSVVR